MHLGVEYEKIDKTDQWLFFAEEKHLFRSIGKKNNTKKAPEGAFFFFWIVVLSKHHRIRNLDLSW